MSAYTQIISVLEAAASTEHHIRKSADDQLKAWEIEPGFHATLQVMRSHTLLGPTSPNVHDTERMLPMTPIWMLRFDYLQ